MSESGAHLLYSCSASWSIRRNFIASAAFTTATALSGSSAIACLYCSEASRSRPVGVRYKLGMVDDNNNNQSVSDDKAGAAADFPRTNQS